MYIGELCCFKDEHLDFEYVTPLTFNNLESMYFVLETKELLVNMIL